MEASEFVFFGCRMDRVKKGQLRLDEGFALGPGKGTV
jgi:hypothetical protein